MTIRRFAQPALIAVVALFVMAAVASASTITYTTPNVTNLPMQNTELGSPAAQYILFPLFNPALGTLTGVSYTVQGDILAAVTLTNGDNVTHTGSAIVTVNYTAGLVGFNTIFNTGTQTLLPGVPYNSGTVAATNSGSSGAITTGLASYVGASGTWQLSVSTLSGISTLGGGGQLSSSQTTQADALGTITYTYNDGTVPEPATLSLIGGALLGLGVFGRKKLFRQ